ncbi:glycoside hydrolase family 30 protein [Cyathus striatus]|nr:glycoside hydrolase family 30 protein [Cyathus striatus]
MRLFLVSVCLLLFQRINSQQIQDVWQTTWDRTKLFSSISVAAPINFFSPGSVGSADIVINDQAVYQTIDGFGASLTDSSALVLNNLKSRNPVNYWAILRYMFNPTDGADAAGLSYVRITVGASDFSPFVYSLDDTSGDTTFANFSINRTPSYVFSVLRDIRSLNDRIKIHLVPWSPPAWMKDSGTMLGGSLQSRYISTYPTYLLKAVQAYQGLGFTVYAISIQNEPQNNNPTYPSATYTPAVEGQIGAGLRTLLNNNGLSNVKVIGYEHNWDNAGSYAVQLMQSNGNAFAGVAFHCYAGPVTNQDQFHSAFPNKEIYFSECSGTYGSDWWSDVKWYMDNLWIGALGHYARNGLMWNIALDGSGNPKLPGTDSCGNGCRPLVTVNNDGSYQFNQEFYSMAQASKAILPKDTGGPYGQRIGVSVGGSLGWSLRVGAYVTGRLSSSNLNRYAIVVMNWNDNVSSGSISPVPVNATIEFRGMQARYIFPVGVTTLWWYAPPTASRRSLNSTSSTFNVTAN